ncbi:MAG: phosphate/phosphite/phosphonate ABC transporter substrate-binding protein [Phycisphaerae bacterium]
MRIIPFILALTAVALVVGLALWYAGMPDLGPEEQGQGPPETPQLSGPAVHLGVVPERDIFAQRRRFRLLASYIGRKLDRPVKVVTLNTYQAVLRDFQEKQVDAAFLGSLVAVLAVDRLDAGVLVKPLYPGDISTYHGVIFVPEVSPIRTVEDLAGRSIAMVKTTTAGELFPLYALMKRGILEGDDAPETVWVGTHDAAILEVLGGRVDAGAAKNLRLDAYLAEQPDAGVRRLAASPPVPNEALIVRRDLARTLGADLKRVLLAMAADPRGAEVLEGFGAERFVPCHLEGFSAVYEMVAELGPHWDRMSVDGPPPERLLDMESP